MPDLGAVRAAGSCPGGSAWGDRRRGRGAARRDLLPVTGSYKQHALYDGRALEAFTDSGAAAEATRAGRLRTAGQPAAYRVSGAAT